MRSIRTGTTPASAKTAIDSIHRSRTVPNLQQQYQTELIPTLMKEFKYKSIMQVPRLTKVVLNIGAGAAMDNPKILDGAVADLQLITGQKPIITKARLSIATFKLREGRQ